MTTLLAWLGLAALVGFGGAFVVAALRNGRRRVALAVALLLVPLVLHRARIVVMVFGVGPAMRRSCRLPVP